MSEPTPEAGAKIHHEYEHTDRPLEDICAEHGISVPKLRYRIKCWAWNRRKLPIPRQGPPPVAMRPSVTSVFHPPPPGEGEEVPADATAPVHPTREVFAAGQYDDPLPPKEREQNAPAAIVPRLQGAVAQVLPAIEAIIARLAGGADNPRTMEQASRALGSLTRTLRQLNALLAEHKGRLDAAHPYADDMPEDLDEFRLELARQIEAFVASRTNEEDAQPACGLGGEPQK